MIFIAVDCDDGSVVRVVVVPFHVVVGMGMRIVTAPIMIMVAIVIVRDVEVQRAADIEMKGGQDLKRQQQCQQRSHEEARARPATFNPSKHVRHSRKILPGFGRIQSSGKS